MSLEYRVVCRTGDTAYLETDRRVAEERLEYTRGFCDVCYRPGEHRIEQREVGQWQPYGDLTNLDAVAEEEWCAVVAKVNSMGSNVPIIQAIKNTRTRTNAGLKEAKDAVDRARTRNPKGIRPVTDAEVQEAIASIQQATQ